VSARSARAVRPPSKPARAARQIFIYIMPSRWYMASMVKAEFRGALFDGAALVANPAPGADAFVCDPGVKACYGRTGEQVRPHPRSDLLLWWFKTRGWNASGDRVSEELVAKSG
jgi:hypothetical protein